MQEMLATFPMIWWRLVGVLQGLLKPHKRHFSFITAHYVWIVSATIVASVAIYGDGKGKVPYIDALLFASGANTQAGLNPMNLNDLTVFQQVIMYVCATLSNPITLHGSVVLLRLYWFEKRFQALVREAKQRRRTITFTKSKSKAHFAGNEPNRGVDGRHITIVPSAGRSPRLANDGVLLNQGPGGEESNAVSAPNSGSASEERDATAITPKSPRNTTDTSFLPRHAEEQHLASQGGERGESAADVDSVGQDPAQAKDKGPEASNNLAVASADNLDQIPISGQQGISFADTVKRSDGVDDGVKLPRLHSTSEHIAILERQRNQDSEVLRIPGPRDAERGLVPRLLDEQDCREEEDGPATLARTWTYESRPGYPSRDTGTVPRRQPTITIAEPKRRTRDEMADEAKAWGRAIDTLRLRKPRVLGSGQRQVHQDKKDKGQKSRLSSFGTFGTFGSIKSRTVSSRDREPYDQMPYLSYTPTIGRNSNFIGLSLEEREELGGIEFRSLRTLLLVLLVYFWGFQLIMLAFLLPYIKENNKYGRIVQSFAITRTWWAIFTSNSAFTDVGFTLTSNSMESFNTSAYVLLVMWFFIIIGNTGFPVMLRFCIWISSHLVPKGSGIWEEFRFLLDHPRRCFTLLFPSAANWWLFWILFILNAVGLLFFMVLDTNSAALKNLSVGNRLVDGLFQAASVRTAGFSCVDLSSLAPAMPVLYLIMMYISVFPIAISIRRTNVYEEKSLGVYSERVEHDDDPDNDAHALSYVGTHLRRQLSFDLWFVFLGFFIISISEGGKIQRGEFPLFNVLFEVVSAYGTVGLSMGAPNTDAALCSQFSVVGKLVIVAMEIRGRHRGLPYGLDRAVLLPSESRFPPETEHELARSNTAGSDAAGSGISSFPSNVGRSRSRGRSMSRARDRGNINLISQLLNPGPVVPHDAIHAPRRRKSSDVHDGLPQAKQWKSQPADTEAGGEVNNLPGTEQPDVSPGTSPTEAFQSAYDA